MQQYVGYQGHNGPCQAIRPAHLWVHGPGGHAPCPSRLPWRIVGGDLLAGPSDAFVRPLRLRQRRDLIARILLDFVRHRRDPAIAVVRRRAAFRPVARDESFDLAVHLHVSCDALEPVPPAMVRLHALDAERVNPFGDALGHFFELWIPRLPTAGPRRIVEQWHVLAAPLLDVVQKPLLDHVRVDRHGAPLRRLFERRFDGDALDPRLRVRRR